MIHVHVFEFSPIRENTNILWNDQRDCLIVDPGCYESHEREELASFIEEHRLKPLRLLNTHGHLDHIFGNRFVCETFGIRPLIHAKEQPVLDMAPAAGLMYQLPFDMYTGTWDYLEEGDTIRLGEDVLRVLFTPGHSPGSVSFYCEKQDLLLSGDVLFRQSIGRTDLPGGDLNTLLQSIRNKILVLPPATRVLSGHGPETTVGQEKTDNPFLQ